MLLWIPSDCDVVGNEKADELARLGTEMDQDNTFITHKIVKAKIMNQKWRIQNEKAQAIYQNRQSLKPKSNRHGQREFEPNMRSCRAVMPWNSDETRVQPAKGCGIDETITHVLCECVLGCPASFDPKKLGD